MRFHGRSSAWNGVFLAVLISVLSLCFGPPSHAQPLSIQQASLNLKQTLKPRPIEPHISEETREARLLYKAGNREFDVKNYEKAITNYVRAIQLEPSFPPLHYNLGMIYVAIGHKKEAAQCFKSFLNLKPNAINAHEVSQLIQFLDR